MKKVHAEEITFIPSSHFLNHLSSLRVNRVLEFIPAVKGERQGTLCTKDIFNLNETFSLDK